MSENVWIIALGENSNLWNFCKDNKCICIGWDKIGNARGLTKEKIYELLQQASEEYQKKDPSQAANMIYAFANEMKEGDLVIVRKGITEILGIGEIISDYIAPTDMNNPQKNDWCKHVRKVKWLNTTKREILSGQFPRATLAKSDLNDKRFDEILKEIL